MPEYINPNPYTVWLAGPNGEKIKIRSNQKKNLDSFYNRYTTRGFIQLSSSVEQKEEQSKESKPKVRLAKKNNKVQAGARSNSGRRGVGDKAREIRKKRHAISKAQKISNNSMRRKKVNEIRRHNKNGKRNRVVGKKLAIDATKRLHDDLKTSQFPISNNIGVGILSYNRKESLKRLVRSIVQYTNLDRTTIFISDDGSTDRPTLDYLDEIAKNHRIIIIRNKENVGVAANSNRLLRCLFRFKYGLLLNDDVEVLQDGWDRFYVEATKNTDIHHFQFRQPGVYGAEPGDLIDKGQFHIRKVDCRPHGAVLSFTNEMLTECGYFDENYGKYGMEHVDWSMKPAEFDMQDSGFFDVEGSDSYFRLHQDVSSLDKVRSALLKGARSVFAKREPRRRVQPSDKTRVPSVSYVIPFRNIDREDSILSVVSNIRAQKFPSIDINIVEQDTRTKINVNKFSPVSYHLAREESNLLFNKSKAFNLGVSRCKYDKLVLHDADMLVPSGYTKEASNLLDEYDGCHLGGTVIYTSRKSMADINKTGGVDTSTSCDRIVGYFEGGSIACTSDAYWSVGGFNEDFWGYGCEDCDFYARLSKYVRWKEDRSFDFLHLWHGRVNGWDDHHENNKAIEKKLCQMTIETRINMQKSQLRKLGYGQFVDK